MLRKLDDKALYINPEDLKTIFLNKFSPRYYKEQKDLFKEAIQALNEKKETKFLDLIEKVKISTLIEIITQLNKEGYMFN